MATIILTSIHKDTDNRYFYEFDTNSGYPKTVEMDLITFLQFKGIRNKVFINVLYSVFERLIINGSTSRDVFSLTKKQSIRYDHFDSVEGKKMNHQLLVLFQSSVHFDVFYEKYITLTSSLNPVLPKPINYYYSFSHTSKNLLRYNAEVLKILNKCSSKYGVTMDQFDSFENFLDEEFILKNKKFVTEFYFKLGQSNLISIDAIPHVLRDEPTIKSLFLDFGLDTLLPENIIKYELFSIPIIQLKHFDELKFLRQFANNFSFSDFEAGQKLIGKNLLKLSDVQIIKLLSDSFCYVRKVLNFTDQFGNIIQPMMFSGDENDVDFFNQNTSHDLIFLDTFSMQDYQAFNKCGRMISDEGYYDFYYSQIKNLYAVSLHSSQQFCMLYDPFIETILYKDLKQNMFFERPQIAESDLLEFKTQKSDWLEKESLIHDVKIEFTCDNSKYISSYTTSLALNKEDVNWRFNLLVLNLELNNDINENWIVFNKSILDLKYFKKIDNEEINDNCLIFNFNEMIKNKGNEDDDLPF